MLFGEATVTGALVLNVILREYEKRSGQSVNYSKSTIFYSSNTVEEEKENVSSLLGVSGSSNLENIWTGKGLLEKGLIWKVGTGSSISVLNDVWIPDFNDLKLPVDAISEHYDKVAELIKNHERVWNKEMINNTFREVEAVLILRIPLAQEPHANFLAWNAELSGEYTVRSA
ncbi:hypothetical protein J1N35_026918 [Gossypium stocksii]|uniref:Reverse transcriptase n=1 Tax=Gossypium stocksii TaxID=47602 RepID=A0A9D3V9X7_9ROSI|nr:hypothetical protein J1N35_026918 [Gossypium stocksii]